MRDEIIRNKKKPIWEKKINPPRGFQGDKNLLIIK